MPIDLPSQPESRTLAQRLADGKIPAREALRYAILMAEALRDMHAEGRVHGGLTPARVLLTGAELDLLPGKGGTITPYTAPEVLEGQLEPASDIFSFGAIFYEMLTARRAFQGSGAALVDVLASASPAPSGSMLVDCIAGNCLAKDPAARWPGFDRILAELKLMAVLVQQSEPSAPQPADADLAARVVAQEKSIAILQQTVQQALQQLNEQAARLEIRAAAAEDGSPLTNTEAIEARLAGLERMLQAGRDRSLEFERNVAGDFHDFEIGLKTQEASAQSLRSALAQTDDLLERVVEALENLQAAAMEPPDDRAMAAAN